MRSIRAVFDGAGQRVGTSAATVRDAAVVDVGSSSVRLVLYRLEGRSMSVLHNERAVVGLGRELPVTGRLEPEAVARTHIELARFRTLIRTRRVRDVIAVATAAVRAAEDGAAFARVAGRILGARIEILSGADEGRYAGFGVIAADPRARGLVGDLGGSSLEFAHVDAGRDYAEEGTTLALGPLQLAAACKGDLSAARAQIDAALEEAGVESQASSFYLVGGAWRNVARLHMGEAGFPIRAVHGYEIKAKEARAVCQRIAQMSAQEIAARPEVSGRRVEALPLAALVLDRIIKRYRFKRVVVSGYGLREGLLFERLPEPDKRTDPLLAGAETVSRHAGAEPSFWISLQRWVEPLAYAIGPAFSPERDAVLRAAACRLADASERTDPVDRGAPLTFNHILHLTAVAISHPERVFLALALHHRHSGKRLPPASEAALSLLTTEQRGAAMRLGLALRLACDLSARSAALLDMTRIELEGGRAELIIAPQGRSLVNETVRRRLAQFADAAGVRIDIVQS
ncbi:MAG: Ppx/GppA family phosphatase [Caulobacterales bacterium]|nr:Ppx/GppA family phosphatase [Caulobacterales bacterium]